MHHRYELKVTSDLQNLACIGKFVADAARDLGLEEEETYAIEMAVDEACTNVVEHAYAGRSGEPIDVTCYLENDHFVVSIRDQGTSFDPNAVPKPDINAPLEKRSLGGLGMYFMEKLMDEIRFEFDPREGNTLTMIKRRNKA